MRKKHRKTLLINSDHFPLRLISWKRALTLMFAGKASQIDFYKDDSIKDGKGNSYPVPAVIILNRYVRQNHRKARFSPLGVFARDKFTCSYCEDVFRPSELTLDHIIPKSRWKGTSTSRNWTNIVSACQPCNRKKANRTCEESRMYPAFLPFQPSYNQIFIGLHFYYKFEVEWERYLEILPGFKKEVHLAN